ncbi:MAG: Ig-like domain-containing protein, partial [Sulfuritalea sp.]|nr:Ig-like domain-containing protein [Sulfuritalea sp.]
MATTSRYTLQGTGANFMDFHIPYGTISLDGQEIVFKGNSGVDQVYVGSTAGLIFDFTQAGLGADKIYLAGNWADYSRTFSGSVVTFTRTTGGSEVIKSISGDSLIFANGTVSVLNALQFTRGDVGVSEPVPSGETSTAFPMTVAGTLSNTLRAVVQDATGETMALSRPGVAMIVKGGSGVDVVYVTAGANIDGSQLGLGQDKLYLTGNYADYTGSFSGSVVTLTRTVGSDTETVKFLGGSETAYDSVVFANGTARSVDILKFLNGTNVNAPTLNSAELTPLPGPTVTITSNDSSLTVGETATITFTLSEAATDFTAADVTASAGALTSFSGSGTTYTATFTPPGSTDASTVTIGVAAGTFTNAEAQNNSAGSLVLAVDTAVPSAPTINAVATDDVVNAGEAGGAITGTAEAGATIALTLGTSNTRSVTADGSGNWTYTLVAGDITAMGEGAETLSATQTDAAGNASAAATRPVSVDTVVPTITAQAASVGTKTVTLTLGEAVAGTPAAGDFAVLMNSATNTVTAVSASGTTVTLTLTNTIPNNATLTVDYTQGTNKLTDTAGNAVVSVGDALAVTVANDTTVPTVAGVSSTAADGTYNVADVIPVTIQFNEAVTVTGTPLLTLETGAVDRTASYASGSGTNTLVFNYTVQTGDVSSDLGYTSTAALALNGGTIKDEAGNNATLTLASPGTSGSLAFGKALVIDGAAPTITAQAATAGT